MTLVQTAKEVREGGLAARCRGEGRRGPMKVHVADGRAQQDILIFALYMGCRETRLIVTKIGRRVEGGRQSNRIGRVGTYGGES